MKKYYIKTYGCQMNTYDSLKISDLLKTYKNMCETNNIYEANVLILNTCSIREKSQEKVYSELGYWKKIKQIDKDIIICVCGCVASQEGKNILKRAPFIDIIFGPQTIHKLIKMISNVKETNKKQIDVSFPEIEKYDFFPKPTFNKVSAFVSIQEGCNKFCSYCIVPYTRGKEINRNFSDIIYECYILSNQGVKEIILLGQNVNAYVSNKKNGEKVDLALLIYYISEIKGIKRIDFTTSHPVEFTENLMQAYRDVPKLVKHLHLPVQSGSNKILNKMKRGYSIEEYKKKSLN
jgi:tRNA-2-methylthio-N6-dimethylallyladenosine synthase